MVPASAAAACIAMVNCAGNLSGFVNPYLIGVVKDLTGRFDVLSSCQPDHDKYAHSRSSSVSRYRDDNRLRLTRPESVWQHDGELFTSDARSAIAQISPDGTTCLLGKPGALPENVRPNGIARRADGTFIFANLGEAGGI